MIKFSIIIPAYNVEDYIFECLSSVASQSVSGNIFEIIVIDDCSDDNTFNIISSYNRVANYSIISNNKNEGLISGNYYEDLVGINKHDSIRHNFINQLNQTFEA